MFTLDLQSTTFSAAINDAVVQRAGRNGICLVANPGRSWEIKNAMQYTDLPLPVVYLSTVPINRINVHDVSIEANVGYITNMAVPIHCEPPKTADASELLSV